MVKQLTIFSDRQFRWVTYIVAGAAAFILLINLFLIGGDAFVFSFNSAINAPMAVVITIAAIAAWQKVGTETKSRFLWAGILSGWALWALAEIIYGLYSILGQVAPYPSIADIFWMLGYIPMGLGLYMRGRTMPGNPTRPQYMIIGGFSLATILLASIFVFWPTFQSFDPATPMENLINIAYPVEDCLLLIVVWRLFFSYEKGDYAFGWRLLAIGFIFLTIGDLVYLYANSTDPVLYYPDLKANFISRFGADVPYSFSYLLWILGVFALRIPPKKEEDEPAEAPISLKRPQKYCHILIFTKYDNRVIDVSPNFGLLFGTRPTQGKPLAEVLKISEQAGLAIGEKVRDERKVADLPVMIPESSIGPLNSGLCGIAVFNPQGEYSGANLLLSIPVENEVFDESLTPEIKLMIRRLLEQTGSHYRDEIRQFILGYYRPFFKDLFTIVQGQAGAKMSKALLDELEKMASAHSWRIRFSPDAGLEGADSSLDTLKKALPALLDTAKQFVSRVTDQGVVDAHMQKINSRFDENVQKDIVFYG